MKAKRAIVAIPPPLAARIDYHPKLPALRDQLTQRMPMGTVMKVHARLRQAVLARQEPHRPGRAPTRRPRRSTFDNTPPSGSPGILMAFVEAQAARQRLGAVARRAAPRRAEELQRLLRPRRRRPESFHISDWQEEVWTRGCPVCFTAPGVLLDYGTAIRQPAGRIHWAGTETSTYWNGYMDGAVRSGERAAKEVVAVL